MVMLHSTSLLSLLFAGSCAAAFPQALGYNASTPAVVPTTSLPQLESTSVAVEPVSAAPSPVDATFAAPSVQTWPATTWPAAETSSAWPQFSLAPSVAQSPPVVAQSSWESPAAAAVSSAAQSSYVAPVAPAVVSSATSVASAIETVASSVASAASSVASSEIAPVTSAAASLASAVSQIRITSYITQAPITLTRGVLPVTQNSKGEFMVGSDTITPGSSVTEGTGASATIYGVDIGNATTEIWAEKESSTTVFITSTRYAHPILSTGVSNGTIPRPSNILLSGYPYRASGAVTAVTGATGASGSSFTSSASSTSSSSQHSLSYTTGTPVPTNVSTGAGSRNGQTIFACTGLSFIIALAIML